MKINVDYPFSFVKPRYDKRNLQYSISGKNKYPSKKMFEEFLRQYKDVQGTAEIWAVDNLNNATSTIHVDLTYKIKSLPRTPTKKTKCKSEDDHIYMWIDVKDKYYKCIKCGLPETKGFKTPTGRGFK